MESKSVEEIMDSKKNFLNTAEVSAVLGVAPSTFRKRAGEYAEKFPIERIGKKYRIPKEPFVAYNG